MKFLKYDRWKIILIGYLQSTLERNKNPQNITIDAV